MQPHGLQHTRFPCPSLSPRVCSNSCPLSQWCYPTTSSSTATFSSGPHSSPASGSFPISWHQAAKGLELQLQKLLSCYQNHSMIRLPLPKGCSFPTMQSLYISIYKQATLHTKSDLSLCEYEDTTVEECTWNCCGGAPCWVGLGWGSDTLHRTVVTELSF